MHWFETQSDSLLCVGGPILPFYLSAKPAWFKDAYETASLSEYARLLRPGEVLNGSNMVWRRAMLEHLGGFDRHLGVKGGKLSVGEETALFQQLWATREFPSFLYDPEMLVEHLVPASKMTLGYRWARQYAAGRDTGRICSSRGRVKRVLLLGKASLMAVLEALQLITGLLLSADRMHQVVEHGTEVGYWLGIASGAMGLPLTVRQAEHAASSSGAEVQRAA
jgi:hypothetical protein